MGLRFLTTAADWLEMDYEMDTLPRYYDPEDLTTRDQFRRYGLVLSGF